MQLHLASMPSWPRMCIHMSSYVHPSSLHPQGATILDRSGGIYGNGRLYPSHMCWYVPANKNLGMYVCTYVCMYRYAPKTGATPVARDLIFQRRQLIFGFIVGKLMVKWGLHVHTRIHDIMYINGRL